jgi:hypothetical protein
MAKQWSPWIKVPFREDGTLDITPLNDVPRVSGVYAIASKKSSGLFVTHYVGRSRRSMRERLWRHLTGRGNGVVASQLALKETIPAAPASIWIAYLETSEPKLIEAIYLDASDRPICNLIKARLPFGLTKLSVLNAKLEN